MCIRDRLVLGFPNPPGRGPRGTPEVGAGNLHRAGDRRPSSGPLEYAPRADEGQRASPSRDDGLRNLPEHTRG
eukprot:6719118-Alexandrium_andersonii.AAC.1